MPINSLFNLSGRTALITGGSKGLGKSMAQILAEAGANIVLTSRHEEQLKSTLSEINNSTGVQGEFIVGDLAQRTEAERIAQATLKMMGHVDILINNAGANIPAAIDEIKDSDWDRIIELNLNSCMVLTRALVPQMKERNWGRIIHISSIMGLGSKAARNAYSATKHGLIGLAKASSLDLGSYGITVNCIAPGPFLTDLPAGLLNSDQKKQFADRTALGRWGKPEELAGSALLLASDAGSYITGSTLVVDGGVMAQTLP